MIILLIDMLIKKKETYYEALQKSLVGWYENRNTYELIY